MDAISLKKKCYFVLEGLDLVSTEEADKFPQFLKYNLWYDYAMMSLILVSVVAFVLETVESFNAAFSFYFNLVEYVSIVVFTLEYLLRIWCITENPKFSKILSGRLKFAITPIALIDLISFAPAYFYLLLPYSDFRFMRSFRLFRLLKLWRYSSSLRLLTKIIVDKKEHLQVIFFTILLLLIVSASLMHITEREEQPEAFASIPHTMWWSVSTLTTIGYGDIYPKTALGKILGSFVALLGVALFALPAGIISAGFMQEVDKNNRSAIAQRNAEKIRKAFQSNLIKIGEYQTTRRMIDFTTIKSRLALSEEDIFGAIQRNAGYRVRFKKNTKNERFSNTLVLEHFDSNRSYGSFLNRDARITIVSPMSQAENAIGHFTAHLAKYIEADYISNELYGETDDFNSEFAFSFSKNYAYLNENLEHIPKAFLDFKADLNVMIQAQETVFIIQSGSRKSEDFNLHFGGNMGDKNFDKVLYPTFENVKLLESFYETLNFNFLSHDLQYSFATHTHKDFTLPNTLHQYIYQVKKANVITLLIHNDIIEWSDDETYYQIIKILGDTMRAFFMHENKGI